MPILKQRIALEIAKNVKAFLNLDAGVIRGGVPDYEKELTQVRSRLKQKQSRLTGVNQRVAALQARLGARRTRPRQIAEPEEDTQRIVDRFHKLYYDSAASGGTWQNTYWLGVPIWKCPLDLWVYQEIIFDLKPDLIVECGTAFGGSALYMSCMLDLIDKGKVVTIDIEEKQSMPQHERLNYLHGSSTAEEIVDQVRSHVAGSDTVMVILDSDHSKDHVLNELQIYNQFVTKDSYMIVEDSNVNGHPILPEHGPGPMEAVQDFLQMNEEFVVDESKEKFYLTFNPKGFLKKA